MTKNSQLSIYKVRIPITKSALTLCISGDWHYGVEGIDKEAIIEDAIKENEQHKGNLFRIFTGDLEENGLKSSVGHNYDIAIPDPQKQKDGVIGILKSIMKNQYGSKQFPAINSDELTGNNTELGECRAVGVCGNHEYRNRTTTGQWLDKEIYPQAKIATLGMEGIVEITIANTKLKLEKTYKIYVSHRPRKTRTSTIEGIIRNIRKKRMDVPDCDVYIFGHFHRRLIVSDCYYDTKTGSLKKILYVVNPSPMYDAEYSIIDGYSPLLTGYHVNCFLPLELSSGAYGTV